MTDRPPLLLTPGEPAGIGGEITLKAFLARHARAVPPFAVLDDPDRLSALAGRLGMFLDVAPIAHPAQAPALFGHALPVLRLAPLGEVRPGHPSPATAAWVTGAIERGVALVKQGAAAALVTNPIQKSVLTAAGFPHPGHTEFLAELDGPDATPVMMLALEEPPFRVVPVTVHMSLRRAIEGLTTAAIVTAGEVTAAALRDRFGIVTPRLAVAGLNPHAGEEGTLGTEDREVVAPAVTALRRAGIDARGPLPPDTMFHAAARARYDAALCLYHDQALIPLKTVDFERGVNVTLGLSFVRTSPDHGTALDIAGQGVASAESLIAALRLAARLARAA